MYRPKKRNLELDRRVSTEVLGCDVWQDEKGDWKERIFNPLSDGYLSSERLLPAYSSWVEHTSNLREEVHDRTGLTLRCPLTDPVAVCLEALALNGAARYRPSPALISRLAESRWDEIGRWKRALRDVISGPYGRVEGAHVYVLHHAVVFQPMYVGQTTTGVKKRMYGHMSAQSIIGRAITAAMPRFEDWEIEVIAIRSYGYNSLNAAESYFIETLDPKYNIARP
jgi:hypothetical protein